MFAGQELHVVLLHLHGLLVQNPTVGMGKIS